MPKLSLSPRTLARSSALHPWRTILTWIVFLVAITLLSSQFGAASGNDDSEGFTKNRSR